MFKILKIFCVMFSMCFVIYLAKGIIKFGPWGAATGSIRAGLTSTGILAFISGCLCTFIFQYSFKEEKPYRAFFQYSWAWVLITFFWALLPKNYNFTLGKGIWAREENGYLTYYGALNELSNPFTLMALVSTLMLMWVSRGQKD